MLRLLSILLFTLFLTACKEKNITDKRNLQYFGEKITTENPMDFSTFLASTLQRDSITGVKLQARVAEVCQAKGCWMNLVDIQSDSEQSLFVQFKDYGFFMPKDIAGREVIIEGFAYKAITPVEELKHYAEDKGLPEEEIAAIDSPREEWKFLASGVILLPGNGLKMQE